MRNECHKEQEYFDRLVEKTGQIWWGSHTPAGIRRLKRRARLLSENLKDFKSCSILELGCGAGAFSQFILEAPGLSFIHLTCCDISPQAIKVASHRYASDERISFEVADITSLHYDPDTFDAVVGNSILHHLPLEISLKECFRVLRPGGILWFSEPNMLNPEVAIEKNIHCIGKLAQTTKSESAFFRWSLAKMLQAVGFEDVRVDPYDFLHPLVPAFLMGIAETVGKLFEKIPLVKEISGSLLISACKPR